MDKYAIGGLEPNEKDRNEVMKINNVNYLLTDKFKSKLLANIVDWGTFLEIYHDKIDNETMFNQIIKLLDIKENDNIREMMLPLLKKIYKLPVSAHISCMMKQFMVYEPLSIAIHELFTAIKSHYEELIKAFVKLRNLYIETKHGDGKLNNFNKQYDHWMEINEQDNLQSSSVILLLYNQKHGIHFTITCGKYVKNSNCKKISEACNKVKTASKSFHYAGFCPKVPYKRLSILLSFPVNAFTAAIELLNKELSNEPDYEPIVLPDYKQIESELGTLLGERKPPKIEDTYGRETPPKELSDLPLIQWYVSKILELRKSLLNEGKKYEDYFVESAKKINEANEIVKKYFKTLNVL